MTRWDTTLTPAALAALVAKARRSRPELGDEEPELIGEGISTLTYGWAEWVLRISRRHPEPWTWRGGRRHELRLLAELRRRGLPVPADGTVIEEVGGLPSAILERRIVGTPLAPDLVRTDPGLATKIAMILDRLHAVGADEAASLGVPLDDPTGEFRDALAVVELDGGLRRHVESALELLDGRARIRTLCHRDFRVDHLISSRDGDITGLLDLGDLGVDDPAIDLAHLHGELGPDAVARICAAMETADPGLAEAARTFHALWPLLELAPGGDWWGDPATARDRLAALLRP
ncbi:phosphotransferase [Microlunatus parietis]|uniref:Aminoglycoside phosphotransferase (APT) family kinase protein n=1 Tax=Microlunatus parietis TaxID=682979 RepID=A0A7Y9ICE5_9ACTN|nr:phosphotransferase [Microlunatus parietis]NYE74343.1 aminoglycoside phosphotransferase (APT) family kinase protein [Microlunatus parietis]